MIASPIMSKANQVKELLLSEIESGRYGEGDRLPSDNVLMRELKVSRNTVREALSFLTTEGHVIRIQGKGTYVTGNQPSEAPQTTGVIHFIARDELGNQESNPFIGELLRGGLKAVEDERVALKLSTFTANDWFITPQRIDAICAEKPLGIIFAGFSVTANIVKQFHQRNIPCCSIGAPVEGVDIPYVEVDHYNGMQHIINHLLALGHQQIIMLNGTNHRASCTAREAGFKAAMKEAGLTVKPEMIQIPKGTDSHAGRDIISSLIDKKIDFSAMVIYGDYATLGVIQELWKCKKSIPKDVSLIMYSGFEWACRATSYDISRVEQPFNELGNQAVKFLLSGNNSENKQLMMKTTFIKGETCIKVKEG